MSTNIVLCDLSQIMELFKLKTIDGFPTSDQEEFLQLGLKRYKELSKELLNNKDLSEEKKFFYIKELVSVYSEMEAYPPLKNLLKDSPTNNPVLTFQPLFKAVRHVLAHFPFFSRWDDFYFNQDMVNCMNSPGKTIHKYFLAAEKHPEFFFRFKAMDNGEELNGKIMAPVGYDTNIKLTDILSLDDAISLIIGYSHMILSTVIHGQTLTVFDA
ncbi:hypothetical protein QFZ20_002279 [Flavobacterium sp. W4I14]|nr:hypothetical protein [Flavobacterium sp. W4I14]